MAITLDTLTLPNECIWQDEHTWQAVTASMVRTVQGRPIFYSQAVPDESGRPITIGSENAWMTRANILTLQGWSEEAGKSMTLTMHDSTARTVYFRHWEQPVVEVSMVHPIAFPGSTYKYRLLALRLVVA